MPASPANPSSASDSPAGNWQPAGPGDADATLALMREFYREEHLVFEPGQQGAALRAVLADPALGAVFLLRNGNDDGLPPLGHLVLTWACSLEFGGRFILLDELCLAPAARGRGEGQRAVEFAIAWARVQGARAVRLEVAHENPRARGLYHKLGLTAQARDLMTLRLA